MKRHLLFKSLLLLCALVVGTNAWAVDIALTTTAVTIDDFSPVGSSYVSPAANKTIGGYTWSVYQCMNLGKYSGVTYNNLQMKSGVGTITSPTITSSNGFTVTVTYSSSKALTLQIGSETAQTGTTTATNNQAGTGASVTATTTSTSTSFKLSAGAAVAYVSSIVITPTTGGGPVTYSVNYDGNGATSGSAPTDETAYSSGATVTVLGNTGSLEKTGYAFGGWNTKSDGTGTNYSPGATFSISSTTTLYAKWNFVVTDGIFDFVEASKQNPIEDYGSGMNLSTSYTTGTKTWEAGNVTMVTSRVSGNGYRWYTDGTLRFYDESKATFSVPSGYVITKIVTTGANFDKSNVGLLSGSTWTGASNAVELSATNGRNIKTITVTYIPTPGPTDPVDDGAGHLTLTTSANMDGWRAFYDASKNYSVDNNTKVYVADKDAVGTTITLKAIEGIPAGVPVILHTTSAADSHKMTLTVVTAGTYTYGGTNYLKVTNGGEAIDAYRLGYNSTDGVAFYPYAVASAPAGVIYLELPAGARVLEMNLEDGDVTAIETVKSEKADGQYYNLAGQRVAQPTKGLYIVNGKKVIIK